MIPVGVNLLTLLGCDDNAAKNSLLLLQALVRMIPIGASLFDGELITKGLPWLNRWGGHEGHTVLFVRHQHPMPMEQSRFLEVVMNSNNGGIPLTKT